MSFNGFHMGGSYGNVSIDVETETLYSLEAHMLNLFTIAQLLPEVLLLD